MIKFSDFEIDFFKCKFDGSFRIIFLIEFLSWKVDSLKNFLCYFSLYFHCLLSFNLAHSIPILYFFIFFVQFPLVCLHVSFDSCFEIFYWLFEAWYLSSLVLRINFEQVMFHFQRKELILRYGKFFTVIYIFFGWPFWGLSTGTCNALYSV